MKTDVNAEGFNSLLSLRPLVAVLKKMIAEGKPGAKKLYQGLINEIESRPELLQPMKDASVLEKDAELVETLLSTIFPPSTTSNQGAYAICFPFLPKTIYASPVFKGLFLRKNSNIISFPDEETNVNIRKSILSLAYDLILKKFCSHAVPLTTNSVHPFKDDSGLTKYFELKLNVEFVEVKTVNGYTFPEDFAPKQTLELNELMEALPLENFLFEGLIVVEVNNVTQEQVIVEIKNALLN